MRYHILITSVLMINTMVCYSQWSQTDGPYGQTGVTALIQKDSIIIASANCGYFSKVTLTDKWSLNSGQRFVSHTLKGDSLYIGGSGGLKLIDLSDASNPVIDIAELNTTSLSHSDSSLYGGVDELGFFKIGMDGNSWSIHNDGLPTDTIWSDWGTRYETRIFCIEVTSNYIFVGTDKGIYRNTGNLHTWEEVNLGLTEDKVTFISEHNGSLYTAIEKDLYRSDDDGAHWDLMYAAPSEITSMLSRNNNLYIGTKINGILYSENNGVIWNSLNEGLTDYSVNTLSDYDTTLICGTAGEGVFLFQNNTWIKNYRGMICSHVREIASTGHSLIANDCLNLYKSSGMEGWGKLDIPEIPVYPNLSACIISIETMGDTIFYSYHFSVPEWPYFHNYILYSIDNGETWVDMHSTFAYEPNNAYKLYIDDKRVYGYESDHMFFSDHLGADMTEINLPSEYCNMFYDFLVFEDIPFAAACGNGQLLKLISNEHWVLSNTGLPADREPWSLAYCDGALFTFIVEEGMHVSFDKGNSWTYASDGLNVDWGIRDFTHYGPHLFVSSSNGVFVTSNFGQNWYPYNDGLINLNTSALTILNDTLYVGTYGNGIWKQAIEDMHLSVPESKHEDPAIKIFPNPAADYIQIDERHHHFNRVQIYDLMGRQVISENLYAGHRVRLQHISNGTYIVMLISDQEIWKGKLVIRK